MPAPNAQMFAQVAKQRFKSFAITVPDGWVQPQGEAGQQYVESMSPAEHNDVPLADALFRAASTNTYHVGTQKDLHQTFSSFIDQVAQGVTTAWRTWQNGASFSLITINTVTASGGQLASPVDMGTLILQAAPPKTPAAAGYMNAIANTIGPAWLAYTSTIKFTAAPIFPSFAAFPGPIAPPLPGTPWPLASLAQIPASVNKEVLKGGMIAKLGDPQARYHVELFDSIATAFEACFSAWVASTQVTNVIGTGPVPTFAPPIVPAGPVLGGVGTMAPGGLV